MCKQDIEIGRRTKYTPRRKVLVPDTVVELLPGDGGRIRFTGGLSNAFTGITSAGLEGVLTQVALSVVIGYVVRVPGPIPPATVDAVIPLGGFSLNQPVCLIRIEDVGIGLCEPLVAFYRSPSGFAPSNILIDYQGVSLVEDLSQI